MIFQIRWRRSLHQRPDPTAIASASDCVVVHERGVRRLTPDLLLVLGKGTLAAIAVTG